MCFDTQHDHAAAKVRALFSPCWARALQCNLQMQCRGVSNTVTFERAFTAMQAPSLPWHLFSAIHVACSAQGVEKLPRGRGGCSRLHTVAQQTRCHNACSQRSHTSLDGCITRPFAPRTTCKQWLQPAVEIAEHGNRQRTAARHMQPAALASSDVTVWSTNELN